MLITKWHGVWWKIVRSAKNLYEKLKIQSWVLCHLNKKVVKSCLEAKECKKSECETNSKDETEKEFDWSKMYLGTKPDKQ